MLTIKDLPGFSSLPQPVQEAVQKGEPGSILEDKELTTVLYKWMEVVKNQNLTPDLRKAVTQLVESGFARKISDIAQIHLKLSPDEEGCSQLHHAAASGNLDRVKELIALGDPYLEKMCQPDNMKQTPLHRALLNQHAQVVDALLQVAPDILIKLCQPDVFGDTPLHLEALKGGAAVLEKVKNLPLNLIAKLFERDGDGYTPLTLAVYSGNVSFIQGLLTITDRPVIRSMCRPDILGNNPLHRAVLEGRIPILEALRPLWSEMLEANNEGDTPLLLALKKEQQEICYTLFNAMDEEMKEKACEPAKDGNTLLHWAAAKKFDVFVDSLLKGGDSIVNKLCQPNNRGVTPLHLAARYNAIEIAKKLLTLKKETVEILCEQEVNGNTPLHWAVASENGLQITRALCPFWNKMCKPNKEGDTPLLLSIKLGKADIAQELLSGLDDQSIKKMCLPNEKDRSTPLHWAIAKGQIEFAKSLLPYCDTMCEPDRLGNTPLLLALGFKYEGFAQLLCGLENATLEKMCVANENGNTPLFWAVSLNYEAVAERLLKLDQNVVKQMCQPNDQGMTPLHYAASKGSETIVEKLLELDSETLKILVGPNNRGDSPLNFAVSAGNVKIVEKFLALSDKNMIDDLCRPNDEGLSPLGWAIETKSIEIIDKLLKLDKETITLMSSPDILGLTPLHRALESEYSPVAKKLLELYQDDPKMIELLCAPDSHGNTPLHLAGRTGEVEIVKSLLGLDPNLVRMMCRPNRDTHQTPLHFAAMGGHEEVVRQLTNLETEIVAGMCLPDKNGNTPMHQGIISQRPAIVLEIMKFYLEPASSELLDQLDDASLGKLDDILKFPDCSALLKQQISLQFPPEHYVCKIFDIVKKQHEEKAEEATQMITEILDSCKTAEEKIIWINRICSCTPLHELVKECIDSDTCINVFGSTLSIKAQKTLVEKLLPSNIPHCIRGVPKTIQENVLKEERSIFVLHDDMEVEKKCTLKEAIEAFGKQLAEIEPGTIIEQVVSGHLSSFFAPVAPIDLGIALSADPHLQELMIPLWKHLSAEQEKFIVPVLSKENLMLLVNQKISQNAGTIFAAATIDQKSFLIDNVELASQLVQWEQKLKSLDSDLKRRAVELSTLRTSMSVWLNQLNSHERSLKKNEIDPSLTDKIKRKFTEIKVKYKEVDQTAKGYMDEIEISSDDYDEIETRSDDYVDQITDEIMEDPVDFRTPGADDPYWIDLKTISKFKVPGDNSKIKHPLDRETYSISSFHVDQRKKKEIEEWRKKQAKD